MAAARAREQAGERVLHLERGEPDFDTPPHIVEALAAAARAGETHYPDARGTLRAARRRWSRSWRARTASRCEPDDIVVTCGGTHGLFLAFQALLGAGDELLVLSPHWMAIPKLVALRARRALPHAAGLPRAARGRARPGRVRGAPARGDRPADARRSTSTRPTTRPAPCSPREQLDALAEVAIERDLWVVSDEAYEHLLFDGARHVSIASLPGMAERTRQRLHVLQVVRDDRLARRLRRVAAGAARGDGAAARRSTRTHGVFPAVQSAARAAVTGPQDAVETMRARLPGAARPPARRARGPGRDPGAGAARRVLRVRQRRAARAAGATCGRWSRSGSRSGVAVLPGTAFGPEYGDWVRLSLATRREDVREAARAACERTTRDRAARALSRPWATARSAARSTTPAVVACPRCRVVLVRRAAAGDAARAGGRAPRARRRGRRAAVRRARAPRHPHACCAARRCPATASVRRDWSTTRVGRDPGAPRATRREARAVIADYLLALERGGEVRDEDVEGAKTVRARPARPSRRRPPRARRGRLGPLRVAPRALDFFLDLDHEVAGRCAAARSRGGARARTPRPWSRPAPARAARARRRDVVRGPSR